MKARIAEVSSERRRAERQPTDIEATVRELGNTGVEAKVLNISETGFMAASEASFEVGSRIWLMLPGRQRANAIVRWVAGDKIGAEFADPIPAEELPA